jgi:hypothetical protein
VNKKPESALQAGAAIVTERHVRENGPRSSTAYEPLILLSAALEAQTRLSLPSTVEEEESRPDKPQPSQRNSSTLLFEIPLKGRTQAPANEENQPSESQSTISGDTLPERVPLANVTANAQYTPTTLTPVDKDDNKGERPYTHPGLSDTNNNNNDNKHKDVAVVAGLEEATEDDYVVFEKGQGWEDV